MLIPHNVIVTTYAAHNIYGQNAFGVLRFIPFFKLPSFALIVTIIIAATNNTRHQYIIADSIAAVVNVEISFR